MNIKIYKITISNHLWWFHKFCHWCFDITQLFLLSHLKRDDVWLHVVTCLILNLQNYWNSLLTNKRNLSITITYVSSWVPNKFLQQLIVALDAILDIGKTWIKFEQEPYSMRNIFTMKIYVNSPTLSGCHLHFWQFTCKENVDWYHLHSF